MKPTRPMFVHRLIPAVLALFLALGTAACGQAEDRLQIGYAVQNEDIVYVGDNRELELSSVQIPARVEGREVRGILSNAFRGNRFLEYADLSFIQYVGHEVFYRCYGLREVKFGELKVLSEYAFADCYRLESLDFPASLETIGYAALSGCTGLKSLRFASNPELDPSFLFRQEVPDLVIYGPERGSVREFALAHGFAFVPLAPVSGEEGGTP